MKLDEDILMTNFHEKRPCLKVLKWSRTASVFYFVLFSEVHL